MLLDAEEIGSAEPLTADLCIVGAGAAGIALALEFANTGIDVLLLESGGFKPEPETQKLYEGSVSDERLHPTPDRYRQRRLGGSTTIWGGRCMPLDPIDFEKRDWVPHSGWPIARDALDPFYERANRLCEAGEFAYTVDEAFDRPCKAMVSGFEPAHFRTDTLERFSCPTHFGARYRHKLDAAPNIRLVLHANVVSLRQDRDGRTVRSAWVRTLGGRRFEVVARRFVLATGGLEVPRLLLASRDVSPNGIGNAHDVVGRYYMCHMAGTIGTIEFDAPDCQVWHGYEIADDGTYCRRRLALTAAAQRQQRVGNFVARLHHPRITDPAHRTGILSLLFLARFMVPYEYGRRLHGEERMTWSGWWAHAGNVLRDLFGTAAFLWHWLRDRTLAERKFPSIVVHPRRARYSLDFHAEQEPNPESRVRLGSGFDALGMPRLHVDWRYTRGDVATVQRALALLADDLRRSGLGRFDYDPAMVEAEMVRYGAYGGHHIGTTRMGTDPRTSVVDTNCRVHGVDNLYVASAAVFPTSGQANPTLSLVALSLRLAAHLRASLAEPVAALTAEPRSAEFKRIAA